MSERLSKHQRFLLGELERKGRIHWFPRTSIASLRRLEERGFVSLSIGTGGWSATAKGLAALLTNPDKRGEES